jgi:hypothetical protein
MNSTYLLAEQSVPHHGLQCLHELRLVLQRLLRLQTHKRETDREVEGYQPNCPAVHLQTVQPSRPRDSSDPMRRPSIR